MPTTYEYLEAVRNAVGDGRFVLALEHIAIVARALDHDKQQQIAHIKDAHQKKELLDEWFGDFIAEAVKNTVVLIAGNGDWSVLRECAHREQGVAEERIIVTSGTPLSPAVEQWLSQELNHIAPQAPIQFEVDESLIGGVKIKIGDREIDYSFKKRLNAFFV